MSSSSLLLDFTFLTVFLRKRFSLASVGDLKELAFMIIFNDFSFLQTFCSHSLASSNLFG